MVVGIILCFLAIFVGYVIKSDFQKKVKFKLDILNFCDYMKTQINFQKTTLVKAVESYIPNCTTKFAAILTEYIKCVESQREFILNGKDLNFEEKQVIENFFNNLGKSHCISQLELCENTKNLLSSDYQLLKTKYKNDGDLAFKLSICVGILAFILFI